MQRAGGEAGPGHDPPGATTRLAASLRSSDPRAPARIPPAGSGAGEAWPSRAAGTAPHGVARVGRRTFSGAGGSSHQTLRRPFPSPVVPIPPPGEPVRETVPRMEWLPDDQSRISAGPGCATSRVPMRKKHARRRRPGLRRKAGLHAGSLPDPGDGRIRAWTAEIGRELIAASGWIDDHNFTSIHPRDLETLFCAYDRRFLEGFLRERLAEEDLSFRLSTRMTRAAGKTSYRPGAHRRTRYEIAISTEMLFHGFDEDEAPIDVVGLPCATRLEALQRVFEHELVHLVEFVGTGTSNCKAPPFHELAHRLFRHRHYTHTLVTRPERAAKHGIHIGSLVSFTYRGRCCEGRVGRITKRATVFVEDPEGRWHADGRSYRKYYVPLDELEPVNE